MNYFIKFTYKDHPYRVYLYELTTDLKLIKLVYSDNSFDTTFGIWVDSVVEWGKVSSRFKADILTEDEAFLELL